MTLILPTGPGFYNIPPQHWTRMEVEVETFSISITTVLGVLCLTTLRCDSIGLNRQLTLFVFTGLEVWMLQVD